MNIEQQLAKLGIARVGLFGKRIGGFLYIHRAYEDNLEQLKSFATLNLQHYRSQLPTDFAYDIVKIGNDRVAFIQCPTFNELDEPLVGDSVLVTADGQVRITRMGKNPMVYHHRWQFVCDNYSGFSVKQAKHRSIWWKSQIGSNREISSRIGRKEYWDGLLAKLN